MSKKNIRETSGDTRLLYQRLVRAEIGDFISYKELCEIIDRDVQKEGRCYLVTARKMAQRDDDKVFGVVTNEGLKCLNSTEIIDTAAFSIEHIKRTSRKTIRRISCIQDISTLPNEEKIRFNTYASTIGAISVMTKGSSIKKIEAKVQETQEQLPYIKTLDAFKGTVNIKNFDTPNDVA